MQKYKKIILLILITLIITNCGNKNYKLNEEITLKGRISTTEITKDNETKKVKVLNLDEPIIIDGTKINKIEIDYDKGIKDDYDITIMGKITENNGSNGDLSYSFKVSDIDNILSFINTFGNDDFTFAIPSELMKKINVKEIDKGFTIYSSENSEILSIKAVSKAEFNKINTGNIEKVTSNRNKVVIIEFSSTDKENDNYETASEVLNELPKIKSTVQLK
ncbi:MAG TPA: hypothetical protein DCE23_06985 [Firmicutes bacterium]|nr:hypothetical protein [Bacillota bacterium]